MAFWIPVAVFVLVFLWLLGARAVKRHEFGIALWESPPPPRRWLAVMWLAMAALQVALVTMDPAQRHIGFCAGWVGIGLANALLYGFSPSLSVHEGGLVVGLLCIPWREVSGWSWGNEGAHVNSLSLQGLAPRGLRVWTTPFRQAIWQLGPARPICTRIGQDSDLQALLRQHIPRSERTPEPKAGASDAR